MMEWESDELAHCEYWNTRYKTSTVQRPLSPASSVRTTELANTQANSNYEDKGRQDGDLDSYDWFRNWEHLETWIRNTLPQSTTQPKILHLGCGNSVCRGSCLLHVEPNVGPTPTDMPPDVDKRPTRSWIHRSDQHRLLGGCDKRHGVQIQAS